MTLGRKTRLLGVLVLVLITSSLFSCRKATPPPPPPPPVQPPPPPPAPTITLRAEPATVDRGQTVTLTWSTTNAGTVRIEPGLGDVPMSGNRQVSPTTSVTYNASATGPGGMASDTARVTVNAPPPAPTPPPPPPPRPPTVSISDLFLKNVQEVLFDYDKADIRPDQMGKLRTSAAWLKENPTVRFSIQGHADERGSQEYNLALGDQRANAVKVYLVSEGVAESRMGTISYGEERPQCSQQTEDCFQRNRRAAFVLQ